MCPLCRKELLESGLLCKTCRENIVRAPSNTCACCGSRLDTVLDICSKCIQEESHSWSSAICIFDINKTLHNLILDFKYKNNIELFPFLADEIANRIKEDSLEFDLITAIPLHFLKYFKRGYNQSVLLAKRVSRLTKTPYETTLVRKKYTKTQTALSGEQRRKNLRNVFLTKKRAIIENKDILLVDDIFTTGSTLRSACNALIASGAKKVTILVLARR